MNQQVGAEQEARNIAASRQDVHLLCQAQGRRLAAKSPRRILADDDQARACPLRRRQMRQRQQTAVQPLGLEPRAHLQQQEIFRRQPEFSAERGP